MGAEPLTTAELMGIKALNFIPDRLLARYLADKKWKFISSGETI